jgi:membrane protein
MRLPPRISDSGPRPVRFVQQLLFAPSGPLRAWLERLATVQAVDRGAALGAQAFSALIPLMIVYASVVPLVDADNFADRLIHRFKLSGDAAETVREAVAPSSAVAHSVTVISFLLVIVSGLSFSRAAQRLYELSYQLPALGLRATPWQLLWLALIPVYVAVRPLISGLAGGVWHVIGSLALGALCWLLTPYILLARRMSWPHLLPCAVLTTLGMSALGIGSVVYLPHAVSNASARYGTIGVAFALLSWLVLAGYVMVGCATMGAVALDWVKRRR